MVLTREIHVQHIWTSSVKKVIKIKQIKKGKRTFKMIIKSNKIEKFIKENKKLIK